MVKALLTIDRCSRHRFHAVLLQIGNSGRRLTPSKCCGTWDVSVQSWAMSPEQLRELAAEFSRAADECERS